MKKEEFERALKSNDFAVGDTFWLGEIKFEVIDKQGYEWDKEFDKEVAGK